MLNRIYDFCFVYDVLFVFGCSIFDEFGGISVFCFIVNIFVYNIKLFFVEFILNSVVFCDFFFFWGYCFFFSFRVR